MVISVGVQKVVSVSSGSIQHFLIYDRKISIARSHGRFFLCQNRSGHQQTGSSGDHRQEPEPHSRILPPTMVCKIAKRREIIE
jgi:hypothetical protein